MKEEGRAEGGGGKGEGRQQRNHKKHWRSQWHTAEGGRKERGRRRAEGGRRTALTPDPLPEGEGTFPVPGPWPLRSQRAQPVGLGEENPSPFRLPPSALYFPLRAGHAGEAGIGLDGHAEGAGGGLEETLGNVVAVGAAMQYQVQIGQGVGRHRLPKDLD